MSKAPPLRKGQPTTRLTEEEFKSRYRLGFVDPNFDAVRSEIEKVTQAAWENYSDRRKAPRTVPAGSNYQDPSYKLSVDWLETRNRIDLAQKNHASSPSRILVINASPRNENTCPQEISKSFRLADKALAVIKDAGLESELLDLSRTTAEFGKTIYPCKACVSTAMPLCHWPCSCYPNHSLGQIHDWMNDIYEMWVRAHGILIITPVHWYQAPSPLKLMIDRLVCADGGNPDPTSTQGKDGVKAKEIELNGWDYPKHLAGRSFAVVAHGDTAGLDNVRSSLVRWLTDLHLVRAGGSGVVDGYIGYYEPYATSHEALDKNKDFVTEVENATRSLIRQIQIVRTGQYQSPDEGIDHPLQK